MGSHRPLCFGIGLVLTTAAPPVTLLGQNAADTAVVFCDTALMKLAQPGEYGYARHTYADRCEGLHSKQVASRSILRLIGLVRSDTSNLDSLAKVRISWPDFGASHISLEAGSTRPYVIYTMTTVQSGKLGGYLWDTNPSRARGLKPTEFAFLAWLGDFRVPEQNRVHIPLTVSAAPRRDTLAVYHAVVLPTAQLKEVYVSVGEVGVDGRVARWAYEHRPVGDVIYAADAPIPIPLPRLDAHLLKVLLSTQTRDSIPVSIDFFTRIP